jgi:hypothetical protein
MLKIAPRLLLPLLALPILGCTSSDPSATVQPTAVTMHEVPAASPTPTAIPRPPAFTPTPRPPDTVWLFDIAGGNRTTLLETPGQNVLQLRFGPDETVLANTLVVDRAGNKVATLRLRYDGSVVSRDPVPRAGDGDCVSASDGAVVRGRAYRDLSCGPISPDARWMTYQVDAGMAQVVTPSPANPNGFSVPVWDQWVVELATDQRRLLQAGLLHCGGCDGRFGPAWSASGRLLYFAELRDNGSTFISDMQTGVTRELFSGSTQISAEPDWSPVTDLLVYRTAAGVTILEDFSAGTRKELPDLLWPVRFDASGAYLYSPGWDNDHRAAGGETKVYDWLTGRVVATLAGQPRYDGLFMPQTTIRSLDGSFVAVLEGGDCGGVAVYRGSTSVACVSGSGGGALSPNGQQVAAARVTREGSGPVPGQLSEYEVVLIDVASGQTRVLASGALSQFLPPELIWNDASTHLLVRWPFSGYGP